MNSWLLVYTDPQDYDNSVMVRYFLYYFWITWTLRATDQKQLGSFEMWCWRRMEKISWTDHVRNLEVLL